MARPGAVMQHGWPFLGRIGQPIVDVGSYIAAVSGLVVATIVEFIRASRRARRHTLDVVARQVLFTGVDALPVVSLIALILGLIIITQAGTQLPRVGAGQYLGNIVVVVLIRELGPLLTAFIVVARSGTAITTELGNMRVGQEVGALEAMGIPVTQYLVFTRMAAVVLSMLSLTLYFDAVAVLGGFMVAKASLTVPFAVFADDLLRALAPMDLVVTVIKAALFGGTIASICCYHGLSVGSSYTEVPQQTTRAMVNSVAACLIFDLSITFAAYL
jgi:phospholipid/cholesterol/gamma-HCH transport system permease protein